MATVYDVERDGKIVAQDVAEKSYKDTGLTANTTYSYRVRAKNAAGVSDWSDVLQVTTKPVPVTGVTLNKTETSIVAGANETLTATVAPANATNKAVTWETSDSNIATVDKTGKVTGVAAGTATITVKTTDGGKTATCKVTVTAAAGES
ncbi:Ig-like domain-containing protein [Heyndrickxia coagulans]|uniref:Ig-like domain-containing protein n=1 Tax=Heyndrickxia coagulans TaxID=1398 RepID=UPI001451E410|nr:Ig-like domain-containing protein [Heyndrickxia coagulans]MED4492825.1 Ig-like domain-containing protein [Heyndrickxia coagulans]MED4535004.1 Ig-like domain-containing protein [Heyndrickxia coagulans]QJE31807.1 Ig domain-containing protein [Heyndrickxia coagulans]